MRQVIAAEVDIRLKKQALDSFKEFKTLSGEVTKEIIDLREQNKRLNKEFREVGSDEKKSLQERIKLRKEISEQIATNSKRIKDLGRSQRALNTEFDSVNDSLGAYDRLNAELLTLRKRIQNARAVGGPVDEGDLKRVKELDAQLKKIDAEVGKFTRNLGNARNTFNGLNSVLGQLGIAGGISGITLAVSDSINTFKNFEQQVAILGAVSRATIGDLQLLEDQAKQIGETTQFTATQVAEAQTDLARAGFAPQEILQTTDALIQGAIATGEEVEAVSNVAAASIRGFGLSAEESGRFVDVLVETLNSSNNQLDDFRESAKILAPVTQTLGISLEEASAAIGILGDNGIKGTDATTTLSSALTRLSDDTKKYATAAENAGVTIFDQNGEFVGLANLIENLQVATADLTDQERQATIGRIFGVQAVKQFTTLLNAQKDVTIDGNTVTLEGAQALAGYTTQLENAGGAAERAATQIGDTLAQDILKSRSAIEGLQIEIVSLANDGLRSLVQGFNSFVSSLTANVEPAVAFIQSLFGPLFQEISRFVENLVGAAESSRSFGEIIIDGIANGLRIVFNVLTGIISLFADFAGAIKQARDEGTLLGKSIDLLIFGFTGFFQVLATLSSILVTITLSLKELPKFINDNKAALAGLAIGILTFNKALIASKFQILAQNAALIAKTATEKAALIATNALAVAQRALNIVLNANPVGILVTALGLFVGIVIDAYNRSQTFRAGIAGLFEVIEQFTTTIGDGLNFLLLSFRDLFSLNFESAFRNFSDGVKKLNPVDLFNNSGSSLAEAYSKGFREKLESEKTNIDQAFQSVAEETGDRNIDIRVDTSNAKEGLNDVKKSSDDVTGSIGELGTSAKSSLRSIAKESIAASGSIAQLEKALSAINDRLKNTNDLELEIKLSQDAEDIELQIQQKNAELQRAIDRTKGILGQQIEVLPTITEQAEAAFNSLTEAFFGVNLESSENPLIDRVESTIGLLGIENQAQLENERELQEELSELKSEFAERNAKKRADEFNDRAQKEAEQLEALNEINRDALAGIGEAFGGLLSLQEEGFDNFGQSIISSLLDTVKRVIQLQLAQMFGISLAQPDSVASFGASGLARYAILAGLVEGFFSAIESSVSRAEKGTVLQGPSHANGGIWVMDKHGAPFVNAEGNEMITTAKTSLNPRSRGIISYVNQLMGGANLGGSFLPRSLSSELNSFISGSSTSFPSFKYIPPPVPIANQGSVLSSPAIIQQQQMAIDYDRMAQAFVRGARGITNVVDVVQTQSALDNLSAVQNNINTF